MTEKTYESFEAKHLPPIGAFIRGFYGGIAGSLRLPTTFRKYKNKQLIGLIKFTYFFLHTIGKLFLN